ncbi:MAG TPA: PipX family protein [Chroococcidiopsis sp.]
MPSKPTSTETYLNHPNFGLLYRVCLIEDTRELFATLYAQRLFFIVITSPTGVQFDPVSRTDARLIVENRLRTLRRNAQLKDYELLHAIYKRAFHQ